MKIKQTIRLSWILLQPSLHPPISCVCLRRNVTWFTSATAVYSMIVAMMRAAGDCTLKRHLQRKGKHCGKSPVDGPIRLSLIISMIRPVDPVGPCEGSGRTSVRAASMWPTVDRHSRCTATPRWRQWRQRLENGKLPFFKKKIMRLHMCGSYCNCDTVFEQAYDRCHCMGSAFQDKWHRLQNMKWTLNPVVLQSDAIAETI